LAIALQPENLFYCFAGVLAGTLSGPASIGRRQRWPSSADHLQPQSISAVIMLAGITTGCVRRVNDAILVNVRERQLCGDVSGRLPDGRKDGRTCAGMAAFGHLSPDIEHRGGHVSCPTSRRSEWHLVPRIFFLMLTSLMIVTYLARAHGQGVDHGGIGLVLGTLGNDPLTGKNASHTAAALRDGIGLIPSS